MSSAPKMPCPTDETLALFVAGDIDAQTRTIVLEHIETCNDCMAAVLTANAHLDEERSAAPGWGHSRWWIGAVAAAVVIAVMAIPFLRHRDNGIGKLVALAPTTERKVEPRLSGGFPWAAYAGSRRAVVEQPDPAQLKLAGEAGEILERANNDSSAGAQHAAGVAYVLIQQPDQAIARLESASNGSRDARTWSDLAAARYAAASQLGRASLYPEALAAADKAVRIDPNLAEALFNRALILERLGLTDDARRAWQRYLEVDSSSSWATEARSRMAQLPALTHASQFEHDRPLLELAAERGDSAGVLRYVEAHPERARAMADAEYLGRWAEAVERNDAVEAARWLAISRGIGDALSRISGEALLRDAVRAIDGASPEERRAIARAHVLYRRARMALSHNQPDAAEGDLSRAADAFEAVRDPMSLQARFYIASTRLKKSDTAGARTLLERARVDSNLHPEYINYAAAVRWELGRALSQEDDWSGAATVFSEGATEFRRGGERVREAFMETMLADALTSLGRNDDAWLARVQAFEALSAEGDMDRLASSIDSAAYAELAAGHRDAALAFFAMQTSIARSGLNSQIAVSAFVNRALLQSMDGDEAGAMQAVQEGTRVVNAVGNPDLRAAWTADVDVARGSTLEASDPRVAAESLTRAIDFFTSHNLPAKTLEPLLLRARCSARKGDTGAAMRDLERGMAIVESHPAGTPGGAAGWSVLDAEHAVFTDAIRLSLDRGDKASAFAFAERLHGTTAMLPDVQRRLAGSGTTVIEIVALPDELVTFAVDEKDTLVVRRPASMETIVALADESLTESGTTAAAKLYDELIRPADASLDRSREVVIVAGQRLAAVPFAALYDTVHHRYLIERLAVSVASSAGALQPDDMPTAAPALAAIALPSGGAESKGLPDAENEVRDIAGLYARATSIPVSDATFARLQAAAAGADVIHIAGHTERQQGGGEQALLFVGTSGTLERVSWKTLIASPPPGRGVVVLAACETLRPPPSAATRAISLGAAFSDGGASDVVGTLTPIGDRDARLLFDALHRHLASGERAADALRAVQEDAIHGETTSGGRHAWRAIALLTRRIPAPSRRKELLHG